VSHTFKLVDVFAEAPFSGNPLAVVFDADSLETERMQHVARWLNFSETVFLCKPTRAGADYRARIFTLDRELPFAGHPTLGACHAWLEAGGQPAGDSGVVQDCGAGLIELRRDGARNAFAAPPTLRSGLVEEPILEEIAGVLRIPRSGIVDAQWVDNGPGWVALMLASAEEVLALEPARGHARRIEIGVVGPHAPGGAAAFELRALFSDQHGALREDPVTGSLNASVAQWLLATGRAVAPYIAAQGTRIGCAGRIHISQDATGQVWVGGAAHTIVTGEIGLD
jgi:PhzF family phenazine biosynthesis protein